MLDAEMLSTIRDMPVEERIALIMALMASLDAQQAEDLQPTRGNQAALESWKASVLQCLQQTDARGQPKRPPFGFMKDTGSIHGDIISPAVPESDWQVLH